MPHFNHIPRPGEIDPYGAKNGFRRERTFQGAYTSVAEAVYGGSQTGKVVERHRPSLLR